MPRSSRPSACSSRAPAQQSQAQQAPQVQSETWQWGCLLQQGTCTATVTSALLLWNCSGDLCLLQQRPCTAMTGKATFVPYGQKLTPIAACFSNTPAQQPHSQLEFCTLQNLTSSRAPAQQRQAQQCCLDAARNRAPQLPAPLRCLFPAKLGARRAPTQQWQAQHCSLKRRSAYLDSCLPL